MGCEDGRVKQVFRAATAGKVSGEGAGGSGGGGAGGSRFAKRKHRCGR